LVDRTRPRPVVKIVGEFYSHLSETDANYKMFQFLEGEGAEVAAGSVGGVLQYWFFKSRQDLLQRWGLNPPNPNPRLWQLRLRFQNWKTSAVKPFIFFLIDRVSRHLYRRTNRALGDLAHVPTQQEVLASAADSYYRPLTRGGEGHLEVGESIHSTSHGGCHMVLSLKPFGCMPSTQSDGVMATVVTHFDEMLFASIETTGDSDINAYSRVQMVLSDAHRRAVREFDEALESAGRRLEEIRAGYVVPKIPGVVGVAANYLLHVSDLMGGSRSLRRGA
ncbi:activator of (R)-2-hydroxyglutaryl-CoA dehydratase, partial [Gemmatimonadota bacterium]